MKHAPYTASLFFIIATTVTFTSLGLGGGFFSSLSGGGFETRHSSVGKFDSLQLHHDRIY
jgi:hypothetical protein